jgi:acyl-CoA thioester hydrolase
MDLAPLLLTYRITVPEEYLDEMEHMNVMWYTHLFDRATWQFFASLDMDLDYFENEKAGAVALEQHTRYLAEVRLGQEVTLRTRAVNRTAKRFHFMHFMTIGDDGVLAATTELIGMHIDYLTRRPASLPEHIAAAFDDLLDRHRTLDWEPPVCGVMSP